MNYLAGWIREMRKKQFGDSLDKFIPFLMESPT